MCSRVPRSRLGTGAYASRFLPRIPSTGKLVEGGLSGFGGQLAPDRSGRGLPSPALRLHAKREREAMMVGQGRCLELWDSGVWSAKLGQALAGSAAPPAGMEDFSL